MDKREDVAMGVMFETDVQQGVTCAMFFLGASIMAALISRRTIGMSLVSFRSWKGVSRARALLVITFICSWCFIMTTGILLFGVGASKNSTSCLVGIVSCISWYAVTKLLVSAFLLERVYIVSGHQGPRWTLRTYQVGMGMMCGYLVIVAVAVVGRNAYFDEQGACRIGLKIYVTAPLIAFDLLLNLYLTLCFVLPLASSHFVNKKLRSVAIRSLIAGCAAMTASTVNIILIAAFEGHQVAWQCLLCCTVDITVNALVLYWVTSGSDQSAEMGALTMNGREIGLDVVVAEKRSADGSHGNSGSASGSRAGGGEGGVRQSGGLGSRGEAPAVADSAPAFEEDAYLRQDANVILPKCATMDRRPSLFGGSSISSGGFMDRRPSIFGGSSQKTVFNAGGVAEAGGNGVDLTVNEEEMSFEGFLNYSMGPTPQPKRDKKKAWMNQQLQSVLFGEERMQGRRGSVSDLPSRRSSHVTTASIQPREHRIESIPELGFQEPDPERYSASSFETQQSSRAPDSRASLLPSRDQDGRESLTSGPDEGSPNSHGEGESSRNMDNRVEPER